MKLANKILSIFKKKAVPIEQKRKSIDYDDVRVLNVSAVQSPLVEIEINSIEKLEEDEYGEYYALQTFIKTSGFEDELSIHINFRKDWYSKEIEEQCHMYGVDCIYSYNDPKYKFYDKLTHATKCKICNLIQDNLPHTEVQRLIELSKNLKKIC